MTTLDPERKFVTSDPECPPIEDIVEKLEFRGDHNSEDRWPTSMEISPGLSGATDLSAYDALLYQLSKRDLGEVPRSACVIDSRWRAREVRHADFHFQADFDAGMVRAAGRADRRMGLRPGGFWRWRRYEGAGQGRGGEDRRGDAPDRSRLGDEVQRPWAGRAD